MNYKQLEGWPVVDSGYCDSIQEAIGHACIAVIDEGEQ